VTADSGLTNAAEEVDGELLDDVEDDEGLRSSAWLLFLMPEESFRKRWTSDEALETSDCLLAARSTSSRSRSSILLRLRTFSAATMNSSNVVWRKMSGTLIWLPLPSVAVVIMAGVNPGRLG